MALELQSQRKLVIFRYDKSKVKGRQISVQASHTVAEPTIEKKNQPNKGTGFVTFGHDFVGGAYLKVVGSSGGSDEGEVQVS